MARAMKLLVLFILLSSATARAQLFDLNDPVFMAAPQNPIPNLLWLPMNDGSGTTVTATVGPNATTDATWVTGVSGTGSALSFNGTSSVASTVSTINWSTNILTITCWLYINATNANKIILESTATFVSNVPTFLLSLNSNGTLEADIHGESGIHYRQETCRAPATGSWVFVAVVYDSLANQSGSNYLGDVKIFYNCQPQTTTIGLNNKQAASNFLTSTLFIGARNGSSAFYDGRIDDLRVYQGELTLPQIQGVMINPK